MRMTESDGGSLEHNIPYGREDDARNLIALLLEEENENPRVVLAGNQGIGKTTLAQSIYEDPRIVKHFERRGWVCTSKDSDLITLVRRILESITQSSWTWAEPSALRRSLEYELFNRRFLIVLDDFCPESSGHWESVLTPLSRGQAGSKVLLVTSDGESPAADASQAMQSYRLERLSEESCWELFRKHAFPSHDHHAADEEDLVSVGRRISEKCNGMLLPIMLLGSALLCSPQTDRFVWEAVCESDEWDSENLAFSAFKISYSPLLLPPDLQLCLSYCTLFPKSHIFDKDQLIRLWTAQGFLNPVAKGKRSEEIGCEHFDELLRRSFFRGSGRHVNEKRGFVMHHQIVDMLTRTLPGNDISRVEDERVCYVREKARHLSFVTGKTGAVVELKCSAESTSLRTFLVITEFQSSSFRRFTCADDLIRVSFSSDLLDKMKSLRTLDLSYTGIEELPDSIGTLTRLRFLGLNHTKIRTLPQSFCNLHNLQTLELNDCPHLLALPVGISSLSNLHHLFISKAHSFALLPRGIGKLTALITLSTFYIGRDSSYYVIRELGDLVNLRGELCISGLSNVISADDTTAADMKNKEFIQKLILEWRSNEVHSERYIIGHINLNDHIIQDENLLEREKNAILQDEEAAADVGETAWISQIDVSCNQTKKTREERCNNRRRIFDLREGVLESLQPHGNIKELVMRNYEGSKLANWMGDSRLSKLVSISLSNCNKCEVLPPLGRLPFLKYLSLKGFNKVKHVGAEFCSHEGDEMKPFSSLEKLEFEGMYAWEEWGGVDGAFPCLSELCLNYCHRLRIIPLAFPSLERIELRYCDDLTRLPDAPLMRSMQVVHCNQKMVSALPEKMAKLGSVKVCYDKFVDFTLG